MEDVQVANKHMKTRLTLLVIRQMKIQTISLCLYQNG